MNIQSAITQGAQILKNKFFLNPYLDSEILMSKVINKDKKYLLLNAQNKIEDKNLNLFKKLINETSKYSKCVFISFKHQNIFNLLKLNKKNPYVR